FIASAFCALLLFAALAQALWQTPQLKLITASGRAVRGHTIKVLLKVRNPHSWPLFPLRMRPALQKDGHPGSLELDSFEIGLKAREEKTLETELVCPHRGEYTVSLPHYYAEDIFGFFALPGRAKPCQKLLSLPRLAFTADGRQENTRLEEEESWQLLKGQQGQLTAESRDYQQGDSLHSIHWKKSASRRALFSRLREHSAEHSCFLLVDNRPLGDGEEAMAYEDRLCEVALSFLFARLTDDQTVTLLPGGESLQSARSIDKAAQLLATVAFAKDTVFDELKYLRETTTLPLDLYIAAAQPVAPLLPLLEKIIGRGCPVTLLAPAANVTAVGRGLRIPLPIIGIDPPQ
ncbi:MAG: DUF58 domain-containing protein, partial [Clostridiales bacterium]|nr:DUF58 domain-containing protein [Clostridiales bacterium]